MNKHVAAAGLAFTVCATGHAVAQTSAAPGSPASVASIERLFEASEVDRLLEAVYGNIDSAMRQGMQRAMQGRPPPTEAQQRAMDRLPARVAALMREEMSWAKLKPTMIQLYAETFSQEEVDAIAAFYRTPAGQALVKKTPALTVKSMEATQALMQGVFPKLDALMKQTLEEAGIQR